MKQFKKWYSLFAVGTILFSTVIQPVQAVGGTTASERVSGEVTEETSESSSLLDGSSQTSELSEGSSQSQEETSQSSVSKESTDKVKERTIKNNIKSELSDTKKREAINIRDLMESSEKFFNDASITVYDKDGNLIDYTKESVPSDATIKIDYNWAIPERLLSEELLQAGDYYEILLPDNLVIKSGKFDLPSDGGKSYGTYEITEDGRIRWKFNELVEKEHDIQGTTTYAQSLSKEILAGENTISIPVNDEFESIVVNIRPKNGTSISKKVDNITDNKKITWRVSINTNLDLLQNATVSDPLPSGTELESLKIYPQTLHLDGTIASVSKTPLIEGQGG